MNKVVCLWLKPTVQGRPFQCLQCPAAFTCKPYLEIHIRTHTGERPYQCDLCLKRFAQKSTLNIHKRIHTGMRSQFRNQHIKLFFFMTLIIFNKCIVQKDVHLNCRVHFMVWKNGFDSFYFFRYAPLWNVFVKRIFSTRFSFYFFFL